MENRDSYKMYRSVVLFSGGLDSLACYHWAKNNINHIGILALYVDLGMPYNITEIAVANDIALQLKIVFKVIPMKFMEAFSDKACHVPFRNLFLLETAALYGDNILFGMLQGELSEDKGYPFVRQMQKLLDSQTKGNLYHPDHRVIIQAPFGKSTKTEVVSYLREQGVSSVGLSQTVGCMNGNVCGQCPPCFNRWIAFENNGLYSVDKYKDRHPSQWGIEEIYRSRRKTGKSIFNKSLLSIPLLKKRRWVQDAWKAYDNYFKRIDSNLTSRKLFMNILRNEL